MAKARALDKRRKSIKNIRKITRTMELVSTAQFRRAMERAISAESYTRRMAKLVSDLARTGLSVDHPLLSNRESTRRAALLIVTANRGMCGGYNSGILRAAMERLEELKKEYEEVELYVSGKRGVSYLKYRGIQTERIFLEFDHKPAYEQVVPLANDCMNRYKNGELDRFEVAYSRFVSLSKQHPHVETLLPLASMTDESETDSSDGKTEYEFLPSPQSILEEIVPNSFRMKLFKCFLDAAVSEQIARMMAMKAATDNADSMISSLTTTFNRARQSQITNEIIEVISGASALN